MYRFQISKISKYFYSHFEKFCNNINLKYENTLFFDSSHNFTSPRITRKKHSAIPSRGVGNFTRRKSILLAREIPGARFSVSLCLPKI